jgi:hypothetical protein
VRAEIASGIEVPAAYWNSNSHCIEAPPIKELRVGSYSAERIRELNAQLVELKARADRAYKSLRQDYNDGRRNTKPTARDVLEAVRGIAKPALVGLIVVQGCARFLDTLTGPGIGKSSAPTIHALATC